MTKQKQSHPHMKFTIIGLVLAIVFLAYVASVVRQGAGSTTTRASRDVFLTPGDDPLSLQMDLQNLQSDPASQYETDLQNAE